MTGPAPEPPRETCGQEMRREYAEWLERMGAPAEQVAAARLAGEPDEPMGMGALRKNVRVAGLLGTLSGVADEIVVALDDRAEPSVHRALSAVADRVIVFPFAEPVDRPLPLRCVARERQGDRVVSVQRGSGL